MTRIAALTIVSLLLMQPLAFAADGLAAGPLHDTRTSRSTLLLPAGGTHAEDFLVPAGVTAIATGPLHILASRSIVVDGVLLGAPGASIRLESAGDIVVRGAILGGDAAEGAGSAASDAGRVTGSDGADAGDVILTAARVILLAGAHVAAGAGGDGADVVVKRIPSGAENHLTVVGGWGGDGGNVVIRFDAAELDGVLVTGAGGRGGDSVVDLRDGDDHDLHTTSVGGDGGGSGSVLLSDAYHASEAFRAIVAPAGAGGDASAHATPADTAIRGCEATPGEHGLAGGTNPVATGGTGSPGYRCSGEKDGMNGGNGGGATARVKAVNKGGSCNNGGHATAYGGAGGRGGNGGTGAWGKDGKFGNDGGRGGQGGSGGRGGAGGTARAFAGNGGTGQSCPSGTTNGGNAYAEGGVGGNGGNGGNGGPGGYGGQGVGNPPCSGRGGRGGWIGTRGAGGDKGGAEATAGKAGSPSGVMGHSTSIVTRAGTPGTSGQPGAKGADGPPPHCRPVPCCDAVMSVVDSGATEALTWLEAVDGVAGGLRANATDLRSMMENEAALALESGWYEHGTRLRSYDNERDFIETECQRMTDHIPDEISSTCESHPEPCARAALCETEMPETPDVPWESVPDYSQPAWPSTPNEPADPDPIVPPGEYPLERNPCEAVDWNLPQQQKHQPCRYKMLVPR